MAHEQEKVYREELYRKLEDILERTEKNDKLYSIFLLSLPGTRHRLDDLLAEVVDLQQEILSAKLDVPMLFNFKKQVYQIERRYTKINSILGFLPSVFIGYLLIFFIGWIVISVDVIGFIVQTLGVKAPEKLISLGIAGAFLYLATGSLAYFENADKTSLNRAGNMLLRIFFAVVVPIVIVILFFDEQGSIKNLELTPELLSFATGYSAKLVIGIFNKIVEKGSNMIESI